RTPHATAVCARVATVLSTALSPGGDARLARLAARVRPGLAAHGPRVCSGLRRAWRPPRLPSAVGVPWATARDPQGAPAPARSGGSEDPHLGHHALAHLLDETGQEPGSQPPDLDGPGRRVGAHDEDAVLEGLGPAVLGDLRTDHLRPAADHPTHGQLVLPAPLLDEGRGRVTDEGGVPGARAGTGPRATAAMRRPPAGRPGPQALGPRRRPRPGQGGGGDLVLGRQLHALTHGDV